MVRMLETLIVVAALAPAPLARAFAAASAAAAAGPKDAQKVIASWPEPARTAAAKLIEKYGAPDSASDEQLSWSDKGKWKKVAVYRDVVQDDDEAATPRFIVNEVHYIVPQSKAAQLIRFERGLVIDEVRETLAAQGESEKQNMLVLNLADEIATGKRTLSSAQKFLKKTQAAIAAGKRFTYLDELKFAPGPVEAAPAVREPALPGFNH
jgi:hypothetical protein